MTKKSKKTLSILELYKAYDFENNAEWQNYYNEKVFPKPKGPLLEKFKRKWYFNNIDKKFDMYYDNILEEIESYNKMLEETKERLNKIKSDDEEPLIREKNPEDEESEKEIGASKEESHNEDPNINDGKEKEAVIKKPYLFKDLLFDLESMICLVFFLTIPFSNQKSMLCIFLKSFSALWRKNLISFKREKLRKLIENEFFYNILYIGSMMVFRNENSNFLFFVFVPFMIQFAISLCEYLNLKKNWAYNLFDNNIK